MANPIVTSLPNYVEEKKLGLIRKMVLGAETAKHINRQTGIKSSAAINILSTSPVLANGKACGWSAQGTAELSQRELETGMIKVNMAFCDKELVGKWAEYQVRIAAGERDLPFEEEFVGSVLDNVNAAVETAIWTGAKATEQFDGFLTQMLGADVTSTITGATASGASAYDAIMQAYMAIPEEILDKAVIFVGKDVYRAFIQDLVAKNYYHYSAGDNASVEFVLPATNTKVIAVNGLNGTNKVVAGDPDNFYLGCDLADENEKFDLWFSKDNDEFRLAMLFNLGVKTAFPDQIVVIEKK